MLTACCVQAVVLIVLPTVKAVRGAAPKLPTARKTRLSKHGSSINGHDHVCVWQFKEA